MSCSIRGRAALAGLCLWCLSWGANPVAAQGADKRLQTLRDRYKQGNMYVASIPLNDMRAVLNDAKKLDDLTKDPADKAALERLKGFLNKYIKMQMNESIAFLQVDLLKLEARYKLMSDTSGNVEDTNWQKGEVISIAVFCDKALARLLSLAKTVTDVEKGVDVMTIKDAWLKAKEFAADPFIPAENLDRLKGGIRDLIERRPREFEKLETDNEPLFNDLKRFKQDYDRQIHEIKDGPDFGLYLDLSKKFGKYLEYQRDIKKKLTTEVDPKPENWKDFTLPPGGLVDPFDPKGPQSLPGLGRPKK